MTSSHPLPVPCRWYSQLARPLDRRSAPRLALLFLDAVLARGRRTVTSWIRAAGLSDELRSCYTSPAAVGKRAEAVSVYLVRFFVKPLLGGVERLTLAVEDTPTRRYGPHVKEAGVHHLPLPDPPALPPLAGPRRAASTALCPVEAVVDGNDRTRQLAPLIPVPVASAVEAEVD